MKLLSASGFLLSPGGRRLTWLTINTDHSVKMLRAKPAAALNAALGSSFHCYYIIMWKYSITISGACKTSSDLLKCFQLIFSNVEDKKVEVFIWLIYFFLFFLNLPYLELQNHFFVFLFGLSPLIHCGFPTHSHMSSSPNHLPQHDSIIPGGAIRKQHGGRPDLSASYWCRGPHCHTVCFYSRENLRFGSPTPHDSGVGPLYVALFCSYKISRFWLECVKLHRGGKSVYSSPVALVSIDADHIV